MRANPLATFWAFSDLVHKTGLFQLHFTKGQNSENGSVTAKFD